MIKCRVYKIIHIFYFNLKIYIISTEVCGGSFLPQRDKSDNASDFDLNLNILFIFFSVIESEEQSPVTTLSLHEYDMLWFEAIKGSFCQAREHLILLFYSMD